MDHIFDLLQWSKPDCRAPRRDRIPWRARVQQEETFWTRRSVYHSSVVATRQASRDCD
jgi:hypothetical protein